MRYRKKLSRKNSKRDFKRKARVSAKNYKTSKRGGYRL